MRAFHNRKVDEIDEMADASAQGRRHLMELARTLGAQTEQTYAVEVPVVLYMDAPGCQATLPR